MMRRVVPSCGIPARLLDPFNPVCPSRFVTRLPERNGLPAQSIVTVMNVTDEKEHPWFVLDERIIPAAAEKFRVWNLSLNRLVGIYAKRDEIPLGVVMPHGAAACAVTPLGKDAVPVGNDGHYGFAEIVRFSADGASFSGRISSLWRYPVAVAFAVPANGGWAVRQKEFPPQADFDSAQF